MLKKITVLELWYSLELLLSATFTHTLFLKFSALFRITNEKNWEILETESCGVSKRPKPESLQIMLKKFKLPLNSLPKLKGLEQHNTAVKSSLLTSKTPFKKFQTRNQKFKLTSRLQIMQYYQLNLLLEVIYKSKVLPSLMTLLSSLCSLMTTWIKASHHIKMKANLKKNHLMQTLQKSN